MSRRREFSRVCVTGLVVGLSGLTSGGARAGGEVDRAALQELFTEGRIARRHGDSALAIERFTQVLAASPESPVALLLRAGAKADQRDFAAALADVELLTKLAPDWPPTESARCYVFTMLGRYAPAKVACDRILELAPGDVAAQVNAAYFHLLTNDLAGARRLFDAGVAQLSSEVQLDELLGPDLDDLVAHGRSADVVRAERARLKLALRARLGPPRMVAQVGHGAAVLSVDFSPDGRLLASGADDNTAALWDVESGRQLRSFGGNPYGVKTVRFAADGRGLLTVASQGPVRRFDLVSGAETGRFPRDGKVRGHVWPGDGDEVWTVVWAANGNDSRLVRADVARGTELASTTIPYALSGDLFELEPGKFHVLVAPPLAKQAHLMLAAIASPIARSPLGAVDPSALAFSPTGDLVAIGDRAGGLMIGAASDLLPTATKAAHGARIAAVTFSLDGARLATASDDGVTKIWRVPGLELESTVQSPRRPSSVAFSPDGQHLGIGNDDGSITLFDLRARETVRMFRGQVRPFVAVVSPDGALFAGKTGSAVRLVTIADGKVKRVLDTGAVNALAFRPDGKALAVSSPDGSLALWDLTTGARSWRTTDTHRTLSGALTLDFSPDGSTIATGGRDALVKLWSAANGGALRTLPSHDDYASTVTSGGLTLVSRGAQITGVRYSPDGRWLASAGSSTQILVRSADDARVRCALQHSTFVADIAFSPDGATLASVSYGEAIGAADYGVKLWRLSDCSELRTLRGHAMAVRGAAFQPGGALLATWGADGVVKLWDPRTGAEQATLAAHDGTVRWATFTPDGAQLVTAGDDGKTKLWRVSDRRELATYLAVGREDWMVATPDGYYSASKGARAALSFVVGLQPYPFEQFDLRLNRPDLVLSRVGRTSPELVRLLERAHVRRLERSGFEEAALSADFALPSLRLVGAPPAVVRGTRLSLHVAATSNGAHLDRLEVSVNGVPMYGARGLPLENGRAEAIERDVVLELSPGANRVDLSVRDEHGAESLVRSVVVRAEAPVEKPNLLLLAVGVSRYATSAYDLDYAAKDARDLAALFQAERGRYGRVDVLQLLDRDATREKILATKARLAQTRPSDELVVFFAGHGVLDEKLDYWFGTHDFDAEHPSARGLSYAALEGLLDGVPARQKLLLIDTCHAGEVDAELGLAEGPVGDGVVVKRSFRGLKRARPATPKAEGAGGLSLALLQELFTELRRGSGASVIASAAGAELAQESAEWSNGVFTSALLDGLRARRADVDGDGEVHVSELRDFVATAVFERTRGAQRPTARRETPDLDFAVVPGAARADARVVTFGQGSGPQGRALLVNTGALTPEDRLVDAELGPIDGDVHVEAQVDARCASTGSGNGMFFRRSGASFLAFNVTSDGRVGFYRVTDGAWTSFALVAGQRDSKVEHPAVRRGAPNRLAARSTASGVELSVNGQVITTVAADGAARGTVGAYLSAECDVEYSGFRVGR